MSGTLPASIRIVEMPVLGAVNDASSVVGERAGSGRFNAPALRDYILASLQNVFATMSALRANTSTAFSVAYLEGYYTLGDGGGGWFAYAPADTTSADNAGTIIVDAVGRRWYRDTQNAPLSVKWFGAKGDGTTDDTTAIRNTIAQGVAVHLPRGTYLVTDALNLVTLGQTVSGAGINNTIISVPATFNLSALGVFSLHANAGNGGATLPGLAQPGPAVTDLDIRFAQVDTATKASLIHFPPAIYVTQTLRWRVERVRIVAGWDGIYAYADPRIAGQVDSVGGAHIYDVQLACLNENIHIDGATDSVRIVNPHFFPFLLTANQTTIYYNPASTVGIVVNRADDFHINGALFFVGLGCKFQASASGAPFGEITGCDFDAYSGIQMLDGTVMMTGCNISSTTAGYQPILMTGGVLIASGISIGAQGLAAGTALVDVVTRAGVSAQMTLSNFVITSTNQDVFSVVVDGTAGSAAVQLTGGAFLKTTGITYANPAVACVGASGVLCMSGCYVTPKGAGSGNFYSTAFDNYHRVTGNSLGGYAQVHPTATLAIYANN
jgi:hypothetical protein